MADDHYVLYIGIGGHCDMIMKQIDLVVLIIHMIT